eukprot:CAMPEP_0206241412 /NCGR_PEP_ID=MMETSP0047_2-20121206/16480_1 /ASSEMBLY_ACC=CAM_ASM_000192 /TAXON_ID=195065 /ORGANISM="Chroomonas mesostigmatica_cf, Strain CCMP1168" /LENGTH=326 /DNA_ID=CAMNT_0053666303 /DNA_START=104 /DNA_END=1081 /DNA_ORIENTATION=+
MPATNWREITYSRAHLRPHDGKDPEVKRLRDQTRVLAKSMDLQSYGLAMKYQKTAAEKKQDLLNKLKQDELERQDQERRNVSEALRMRMEDFTAEWAHKRRVLEEELAQKMVGFEERAQGKREKLQLTLQKQPMPPVKYSSQVRDDRIIEGKLAKAGEFELAARYNKSIAGKTKQEAQEHYERWELGRQRKVERLEEKLKEEEQEARDVCDRERLRFEKRRGVALETLGRNQRALAMDVDHALKNEFGQPREVRKSLTASRAQPKSYASRPETSATFYGRLMMERVGRGSFDVPSVCRLHWGIEDPPKFADLDDLRPNQPKPRPAT